MSAKKQEFLDMKGEAFVTTTKGRLITADLLGPKADITGCHVAISYSHREAFLVRLGKKLNDGEMVKEIGFRRPAGDLIVL